MKKPTEEETNAQLELDYAAGIRTPPGCKRLRTPDDELRSYRKRYPDERIIVCLTYPGKTRDTQ
jgi:hypothetical protein